MSAPQPSSGVPAGSDASPSPTDAPAVARGAADLEQALKEIDVRRIHHVSFTLNDIPFYVTPIKMPSGSQEMRICMQAILGFLPYSMEDTERRYALETIILSTRKLKNVRFGVDYLSRIYVAGFYNTTTLSSPNFIFYPLVSFLQETQAYIDLVGKYL
jgi:hypothetical protein